MTYEFKFPDVGEGIHEGEIVKWLVKEGDKVNADQPLGEVETDKAVVEMPSPKSGKILKLHVAAGGVIHVGDVMVTILEDGETETAKPAEAKSSAPAPVSSATASGNVPYTGSVVGFLEEAKDVKPIVSQSTAQTVSQSSASSDAGILATPPVRNLAKQLNVDLSKVKGTGQGGRITMEDVQKAKSSAPATPAPPSSEIKDSGFKVVRKYDFFGYIDRVKMHGIRKIVAQKMADSIFTAAQLTNMNEADVTDLVALREKEKIEYEKEGIKLTFLPYIIKATALSLKDHPNLNASLEGDEIIQKKYYNIGIAVDTEDGLFVPVLKGAYAKDVKTLAKDAEKLISDSKTRKINMMDLKGGSFTISNLGSVGVEFFTPIINYPESAILGVGKIIEKPVARTGKIEIRRMLPLSLTYDHRIVDGAQAARFMMDLITRLQLCDFSAK
ncbi:MAG: dihydrolipoamide acetyltransferase family protein [Nanoarchaeota archaeon]